MSSIMEKERWRKIEPIVDRGLSIESHRKREEFIRKACDTKKLYHQVAELISSIEEAEERGFLE